MNKLLNYYIQTKNLNYHHACVTYTIHNITHMQKYYKKTCGKECSTQPVLYIITVQKLRRVQPAFTRKYTHGISKKCFSCSPRIRIRYEHRDKIVCVRARRPHNKQGTKVLLINTQKHITGWCKGCSNIKSLPCRSRRRLRSAAWTGSRTRARRGCS